MSPVIECAPAILRRLWVTCIATVIAVSVSAPIATAQTKGQVELFGGYAHLLDYRSLQGGSVQVSAGLSPQWAAVLDLDAEYRNVWYDYGKFHIVDAGHFRELHLAGLVGFRRTIGRPARLSGYWQALAGGLQEKLYDVCNSGGNGRPCRPAEDSSQGYFVIQPGLGVTAIVTPRFGIRAQGDLRVGAPDGRNYEYPFGWYRTVAGGFIRFGKPR